MAGGVTYESKAGHPFTPEQIDALVGAVLLEEAFGDDMPADGFDAAFVAESLDTLAQLATLTPQRVAALEIAFAGGPDGVERQLEVETRQHIQQEVPIRTHMGIDERR